MSPLSLVRPLSRFAVPGGVALSIVLMVWFATFSFGAVSGASVAVNESQTLPEIHQEVNVAEEEMKHNLSSNLDGPREFLVLGLHGPIIDVAWDMAHYGIDFGFHNPSEAVLLAEAAGPVMVGWMALLILGLIVRAGRMFA